MSRKETTTGRCSRVAHEEWSGRGSNPQPQHCEGWVSGERGVDSGQHASLAHVLGALALRGLTHGTPDPIYAICQARPGGVLRSGTRTEDAGEDETHAGHGHGHGRAQYRRSHHRAGGPARGRTGGDGDGKHGPRRPGLPRGGVHDRRRGGLAGPGAPVQADPPQTHNPSRPRTHSIEDVRREAGKSAIRFPRSARCLTSPRSESGRSRKARWRSCGVWPGERPYVRRPADLAGRPHPQELARADRVSPGDWTSSIGPFV